MFPFFLIEPPISISLVNEAKTTRGGGQLESGGIYYNWVLFGGVK